MKQVFLYEFNCIEDGEWIPEKVTFEDRLVDSLRFSWNHRYNLERRWIQQRLFGMPLLSGVSRDSGEKNAKSLLVNSEHTAVIGNLLPISIKAWKAGIYRTVKNA